MTAQSLMFTLGALFAASIALHWRHRVNLLAAEYMRLRKDIVGLRRDIGRLTDYSESRIDDLYSRSNADAEYSMRAIKLALTLSSRVDGLEWDGNSQLGKRVAHLELLLMPTTDDACLSDHPAFDSAWVVASSGGKGEVKS